MLWAIRWLIWAMARVLLSLRYRVALTGKDEVFEHHGPYLLLPNHPAYVDPPNLLVRLWPAFQVRPVLMEAIFQNPLLVPFAWLLRGIPVPDTDRPSAEARLRAEQAAAEVVETLKSGRNVILWPSGRLQRDGVERLGGARAAADVLAAVPGVTVVLVRTRGLWGSMFSWAWGGRPPLGRRLAQGAGVLLANLVALAPRRRVTVTMEAFTPDRRPGPARDQLNRWLEMWYNADTGGAPEPPTFVPYHFLFGPRTATFPPPPPPTERDLSTVKPATKQAVSQLIEEQIGRPLVGGEGSPETTLMQLGMDSLDAMEVALRVEQRFGFRGDVVPATVGGLWGLAEGLLETAPPKPPPAGWFNPPAGTGKPEIVGQTVPAAILNAAFRSRRQVIAADDLAGGVTYEQLVVGAWSMSRPFGQIPTSNVGLLLPASAAAGTAVLGLHLADKVPVLLNWTTGPANLAHAAKVTGLTHVVTSKTFIDRTSVEVPGTAYVFLEDVRVSVGRLGPLRRLLAVRLFPGRARDRLIGRVIADPNATAVVLFTSGSERAPKAVPLTHANILADQRACLAALSVSRADSLIGFLPVFHSFGLTVTGLLPLAAGVRVVHHPDPTDAGAIVRKVAAYRPTVLAATPTFLGHILGRAKPGDLDSLRLIVLGAEKPPQALFDRAKQLLPHTELIEGYGITECSPVISVTSPGLGQQGTVGRPLPGVEVCVTDLETGVVLPPGKPGMLNVAGPNVFPGYIAHDGPSPFREVGGRRWYVTGDLGVVDPAGVITIHGRLKRFLKAGGEMISLPALEEPFARLYPPTDNGPRVAVEGVETPTGRRIVLFTTEDIGLRDANAVLEKEGFRGVLRLDEVRRVDALPVLGTGKADYKILRALLSG